MIHAAIRHLPVLLLGLVLSGCVTAPPFENPDGSTPPAPDRIPDRIVQATRNGAAAEQAPGRAAPAARTPVPERVAERVTARAAERAAGPRILAMGDSLMAWHAGSGGAIPDVIGSRLGSRVTSRAVSGARVIYRLPLSGAAGLSIAGQYREGDWDWVVMNGGGNDLLFGCGCLACARRMDRLISADGRSGAIPDMVARARAGRARVVYLGYLRSPGVGSPIEHCRDEGDELDARLARMARSMQGVYFLPLSGLVPYGDRSYHAADMIHPSRKASREIGRMVADLIRAASSRREAPPPDTAPDTAGGTTQK